jgi:hypothetical protein
MNQNLIFVVILLATLSMVNAISYYHHLNKRAATFGPCAQEAPFPITVSLQPDPPVPGQDCTFTVTGTIDSGINAGANLTVIYLDSGDLPINKATIIDICSSGDACPITSLNLVRTIPTPADLPGTYSIFIAIGDENGLPLSCTVGKIAG